MLELGLEQLEQRERVGRTAREPGDDATAGELPHLAGVAFHDRIAKADLPIAGDGDLAIAADRDDRRPSVLFHRCSFC